jgi:hypothetical protein
MRGQIPVARGLVSAAGARSLQIAHQPGPNTIHIAGRYAEQVHALAELIGGMRASRSQRPEFRSHHAEVAGNPLHLAPIQSLQLAAAPPPLPQPRQVRGRPRWFLGSEHGILRCFNQINYGPRLGDPY